MTTLAPGSFLGPYRIVDKLGEGGMGAVYRAHDDRLDRDVALKVLHPDLANDRVRLERFTREARAVAALSHPHIVTIYSTEEADAVRFLTMELVEGRPLDSLVQRGGLATAQFLELALQLTDALAAAHQKQILHRDLKPANVMVTLEGRVKVLDFGLARVSAAEVTTLRSLDETRIALTHEGTIVGTMPYMSPEQIEGSTLDARSDLFSLGVMFYELITGDRPFSGGSSPALMSAILRDTPPSVDLRRPDVPAPLARLVDRCLAKRTDDRPKDAREVFDELRRVRQSVDSLHTASHQQVSAPAASDEERLWVVVLPFSVRGGDKDAETLAEGLTEDITAGLVLFPMLSVVSQRVARDASMTDMEARPAGDRAGARFVLAGSVRKSSTAVRITASLSDAGTGLNLWTDTYHRHADADLFSVQDDVTDRIVATVADPSGVLARTMVQSVREIPIHELSVRELLLRATHFHFRPDPHLHAELRAAFETRLQRTPDHPKLLAAVAELYVAEHALMFNPLPDPLGRVMRAARRSVEIDSGYQAGWEALVLGCFFRFDREGMVDAAEHAIALNPRNANALAWIGNLHTHAGEYDRGCELTGRAIALNAAHPGWYHFAAFNRAFAQADYSAALAAARKVNIREFLWMHIAIAAAAGQLQMPEEGRESVAAFEMLAPNLADEAVLHDLIARWYWDNEMLERLMAGVRLSKAFPQNRPVSSSTSTRRPASGHLSTGRVTASDLRVAVAPFVVPSGDSAAVSLAEGLRDDLTTNLSRFPYVRIVALPAGDQQTLQQPRAPGRLQARFVLDGSVRQSEGSVRVNARLSDVVSGAQLWAASFDDVMSGHGVSAHDRLANQITAQVADPFGALVRSMGASLAETPWNEMTVADLVILFYSHLERLEREQHARLRSAFEQALEREPREANGWACLAHLYSQEFDLGLNPQPDAMARHRRTAEHAIALDSMNQNGWMNLASALYFSGDMEAAEPAAARAISLNPLNTHVLTYLGTGLSQSQTPERGVAMIRQALLLNPHLPGLVHVPLALDHYRKGEYAAAIREAKLVNSRTLPMPPMIIAASAGQLGSVDVASTALHDVDRLKPGATAAPRAASTWPPFLKMASLVEALGEGLEKAVRLARG
jgi:TolB-like protein